MKWYRVAALHNGAELYRCPVCGAITDDKDFHTDWHEKERDIVKTVLKAFKTIREELYG